MITLEMPRATALAAGTLVDHGEMPLVRLDGLRHGVAEVMEDFFPPDPVP